MLHATPFTTRNHRQQAATLYDRACAVLRHDLTYGRHLPDAYLAQYHFRFIEQIAIQLALLDISGGNRACSIGGWPGITAIALRLHGCEVTLLDNPGVLGAAARKSYLQLGIVPVAFDIAKTGRQGLPLPGRYDIIECCACIEHWNFNPLPAVRSMFDHLQPDGRVFLTIPNAVDLYHRVKMLLGHGFGPPMESFRTQDEGGFINPHWREYTLDDIKKLAVFSGGRPDRTWYLFTKNHTNRNTLPRRFYRLLLRMIPQFREEVAIIAGRDKAARPQPAPQMAKPAVTGKQRA
jgi:SAM-dependent methyltransferase